MPKKSKTVLKRFKIVFDHESNVWNCTEFIPLNIKGIKFAELERMIIAREHACDPKFKDVPIENLILVNPGSWQVIEREDLRRERMA